MTSRPESAEAAEYTFGPFRLVRQGERLYRDGRLIKLGSRARQILTCLVDRAGDVVDKRELLDIVWPNTIVVEANLTVHIAALRQALGETRDGPGYIVNVPGRGYRFIAKVERTMQAPAGDGGDEGSNNLPLRLTRPIGRGRQIEEIADWVRQSAIVTVTGPAGVGKTTVSVSVGEGATADYRDGVWFVDLAPIEDAADVATTLAAVIHAELRAGDPLTALAAALRSKEALFIVDNCEHLIDTVAELVLAVCSTCPRIRILATSREPLNISGERIYRLHPLEVPPASMLVGAVDVLSYPAVQLLAERASAAMFDFEINDQNALSAALICRRLDGIPLAIEFAAALVGTLGLEGMAGRLDQHLRLIEIDRRGGTARHRTLEAALDWSYRLLTVEEQAVLRRLAIFAGGFSMDAAENVVPAPDDQFDVGSILAGLTLKSLIASDITGPELRFRVLETTRAFALARLDESGERARVADRHARYYAAYLRAQRETMEQREVAADAPELDNIRAALRHELAASRACTDTALGLASGALPIWFGLSLMRECHVRLQEVDARLSPEQRDTVEGWDLAVALRTAEMFTRGVSSSTASSWTEPPADPGNQGSSWSWVADMLTNWTWHIRLPNYAEMMRLATIHATAARRSRSEKDRIMSAWVLGLSLHHIGDLIAARGHLSQFLMMESVEDRRLFLSRTGFDRRPGAQAMLGATLCQLGDVAEGLRQADLAERESIATNRSLPMCEGLMWVCAARLIAQEGSDAVTPVLRDLVRVAEENSLKSHFGVALGLQAVVALRAGDWGAAEDLAGRAIATLNASRYGPFNPWFTGVYAVAMARQGRATDALAALHRFRERNINGDCWCTAELLRHEAEVLDVIGAEEDEILPPLDRAIALARTQASLTWEALGEITRDEVRQSLGQDRDDANLARLRDRLTGRANDALMARIEARLG